MFSVAFRIYQAFVTHNALEIYMTHINWRVREELKPLLAPVGDDCQSQLKGHYLDKSISAPPARYNSRTPAPYCAHICTVTDPCKVPYRIIVKVLEEREDQFWGIIELAKYL